MNKQDLITAGFERIDPKLLNGRAPRINWGLIYRGKSDKEKITYLEKLAATMNHAVYLIQEERNKLGELCELKEQQLIKMSESVRTNNMMLQQEITRMNEQRQGYHTVVASLNAEIKEMKSGNNN